MSTCGLLVTLLPDLAALLMIARAAAALAHVALAVDLHFAEGELADFHFLIPFKMRENSSILSMVLA